MTGLLYINDVDVCRLNRMLELHEQLEALYKQMSPILVECDVSGYVNDVEEKRLVEARRRQKVIYSLEIWLDMMEGLGEFAELSQTRFSSPDRRHRFPADHLPWYPSAREVLE